MRLEDRQVLSASTLPVGDLGDVLSAAADTSLGGDAGGDAGSFSHSESIGTGTDVDLYSIRAEAGSRLILTTSGEDGTGTTLRLFDSLGNQLAGTLGGDLDGQSRLDVTVANGGTYFIGVSGAGNDAYEPVAGRGTVAGATGDYDISALLVIDTELDGDAGAALINGSIGEAGLGHEIDLYRFEAQAGATLTARTSLPDGATDQTNTFLRLFDANGNQLTFDDDGGAGLHSQFDVTFLSGGTYFVGVSAFPNIYYNPTDGTGTFAGDTGEYRLSLSFDAGDTLGTAANTGLAGASATQFSVIESLGNGPAAAADVDLFRFEADAGDELTAQTFAVAGSPSPDTTLRLFDANGTEIAFDDDGGSGLLSRIDFTIATAGTYYLGVAGFPNTLYDPVSGSGAEAGETGDYRIQIALSGPPATVSGTVFRDEDGDGVFDGGEPGQAGVTVFVDANQNGQLDGVATVSSTDVPLAIPDAFFGFATPVTSQLTVAGLSGAIQDVNVTLNVTHTFNPDLDIFLISPDGTRIALALEADFDLDGEDLTDTTFDDEADTEIFFGSAPYTGRFQPNEFLSNLDGEDPNGVWQLELTDYFDFDTGTLNSWSITISTNDAETHTLTDVNGAYTLTDLEPGTYTVAQIVPADHVQTFPPAAAPQTVTVGPAQLVENVNFGNQPIIGEIRGTKFEDVNEDGLRDPDEPGIAGVTIFLDENGNGQFDGSFEFDSADVPVFIPDLQTITSTIDISGLTGDIADLDLTLNVSHQFVDDLDLFLISPDGTRVALALGSNFDISGVDLDGTTFDDEALQSITFAFDPYSGSFRPVGSLAALDGADPNGTWTLEITDTFLADAGWLNSWSLAVTTTEVEPSAITDAAGNYAFTGVQPGTYVVREVPQFNFVQTFPAGDGSHTVNLAQGEVVTDVDFGNRFGFAEIQGTVFEDLDSDGIQDVGEAGIGDALVFVDLDGDKFFSGFEPFAFTGFDGTYSIDGIEPGTHTIVQESPGGFLQVTAFDPTQQVTLSADEQRFNVNFGNQQSVLVSGTVFEDLNADGMQDLRDLDGDSLPDEIGLSGFLVQASDSLGQRSTFTNFDGSYELEVLPGIVSLVQPPQFGFEVVAPDVRFHNLLLPPGQNAEGVNFGNQEVGDDFNTARFLPTFPNSSFSFQSAIHEFGDVDFYRVFAQQDGFLAVQMTTPDGVLDSFLQVFDGQGNLIQEADDTGGILDSLVAFQVAEGQTFFIAASASPFGFSQTETGDYELTITSTGAAQPLALAPGETGQFTGSANGDIGESGQVHVFELTIPAGVPAGSLLTLDLQSVNGAQLDPVLLLFDATTGELLDVNDDAFELNFDSQLQRQVTAGDSFFVVAAGVQDTFGSFRLTAAAGPTSDDFGNDLAGASELLLDGNFGFQQGSIETPFDVDAFVVQAPFGTGTLTIDLVSSGGLDPVLEVTNLTTGAVSFNDDVDFFGGNLNSQVTVGVTGGEQFLILARGFSDSQGEYALTATFQTINDDFGNTPADAAAIGSVDVEADGTRLVQSGGIDLPGDVDVFQVQIVGGGTLEITQNATPGSGAQPLDPFVRVFEQLRDTQGNLLFDASGNPMTALLASNDDAGFLQLANGDFTFSLDSLVAIEVEDGDVLFVQAGAFGASVGDYELVFAVRDDFPNDLPNASFFALPTAGTTVGGSVESAGDSDVFRFTASADARLSLGLSGQADEVGAEFNPLLTVFQEFDSGKFREVARSGAVDGLTSQIDLFVHAGDEYVVRVAEFGTDTGTYDLSVTPTLGVPEIGNTFADAELIFNPALANFGLDPALFEITAGDTDVFRFVARTTGQATFAAPAEGGLNAQVAAFEFIANPGNANNLIPQQIASSGPGGASVTFAVTAGQQYAVRISGLELTTGTYAPQLTVSSNGGGSFTPIGAAGGFVFNDVRQALLTLSSQVMDRSELADRLIQTAVNTFTSSTSFNPNQQYLILVLDPVDSVLSEGPGGPQVGFNGGQGQINEVNGSFFSGDGVVEVLILPTSAQSFNLNLAGLGADFLFEARLLTPGGPEGGVAATVTTSAGSQFNSGAFNQSLLGSLSLVLDFTGQAPGGAGGSAAGPSDVGLTFALNGQGQGTGVNGFGNGLNAAGLALSTEAAEAIQQLQQAAALDPAAGGSTFEGWERLWETFRIGENYVRDVLATVDEWVAESVGVPSGLENVVDGSLDLLSDDLEQLLKKRQWLWSALGNQSPATPLKLFFQMRDAVERFTPALMDRAPAQDAPAGDSATPNGSADLPEDGPSAEQVESLPGDDDASTRDGSERSSVQTAAAVTDDRPATRLLRARPRLTRLFR